MLTPSMWDIPFHFLYILLFFVLFSYDFFFHGSKISMLKRNHGLESMIIIIRNQLFPIQIQLAVLLQRFFMKLIDILAPKNYLHGV